MFFRLKHSKSGQVLQLLESYRNSEGKPRQRVVVSLGDGAISRPDFGPIAKAVQKQLYGIEELLAPEYTRRQQNWIELILRRIDGVLADKVEHSAAGVLLGPILLGLKGWEKLRMDEALQEVGLNRAQRDAAKVSVINRLWWIQCLRTPCPSGPGRVPWEIFWEWRR